MDRVARRGLLAQAPRALKGGHFEIVNIFVAVEGGTFGEKTNFRKKSLNAEKLKGGNLWGFLTSILSQNIKKLKWGKTFIFGKKSHSAEKLEGGPFGIFQHPFCRKTAKKLKGGRFGNFFSRKKSLAVPEKIERGDPLVLPGMMVCYAGKQKKPFWFSSLDQIVQFGAIIFCRTFNYFGQFVWIEKKSHYNSRVSPHEAPTKKGGAIIHQRE